MPNHIFTLCPLIVKGSITIYIAKILHVIFAMLTTQALIMVFRMLFIAFSVNSSFKVVLS